MQEISTEIAGSQYEDYVGNQYRDYVGSQYGDYVGSQYPETSHERFILERFLKSHQESLCIMSFRHYFIYKQFFN